MSGRERQALARPQTDAAAYEYYLRGRQHLPRMTKVDLDTSARMFERAIGLDPGYAPAFAGLATVHATLYEWFGASEDDLAGAERASQRALELGAGLAETHVARGFVLSLSQRYAEAAAAFERAIAINANLFDAYYYFGRTAFATGDIARSADLFGKAALVRPDDFQSAMLQAQSLRMLGREEEGLGAAREGIRRAEHVLTLNPGDARALSLGSGALAHVGEEGRAIEWAERSLQLYPDDTSSLVNGACLYAKLGRKERALDILERVFAQGSGKRDWIEHDPDYDSLRDDPRFQRMIERLK